MTFTLHVSSNRVHRNLHPADQNLADMVAQPGFQKPFQWKECQLCSPPHCGTVVSLRHHTNTSPYRQCQKNRNIPSFQIFLHNFQYFPQIQQRKVFCFCFKYSPAILHLSIYHKDEKPMPLLLQLSSHWARKRENPSDPGGWTSINGVYIVNEDTKQYYASFKKEIQSIVTTWVELENIMLCEMSHTKKYNRCSHIYVDPKGTDHISGGRREAGRMTGRQHSQRTKSQGEFVLLL